LLHVAVYAGVPAANGAIALAKSILAADASATTNEPAPQGEQHR
jgi:alkylhydroperoxidase/carboxymuconolactone decarboxylase family protein YurZ